MPRLDDARLDLLAALDRRLEAPAPVPSEVEPFEAIASVALGLVAGPRLAPAALDALRDAGLLDPLALASADPAGLDDVLRQARVRIKAKAIRPLQKLAGWAAEAGPDLASASTEALREAWRGLNGIGPATADSLLLHALGRPTYPVDRPTFRILVRHGWLDPSSDYDEARAVAESIAPEDPAALARLASAFDRIGRECCKPSVAHCDRCPLRPLLPDGGPRPIE